MTEPSPRVAVLLTDRARAMVMSDRAAERLDALTEVTWASGNADDWDLDSLLEGAVAAVTGWFTPWIGADLLERHPRLRFLAHTAGSVRGLLPLELVGARLRVSHATPLFAPAVSEFTIMQMLSCLRHLPALDKGMKAGAAWDSFDGRYRAGLLGSRTVGVIGASRSGRAVITLLRAFGATVLVVDPTVSEEDVAALGAERVELDELLRRSDIVTLHAPLLPETEGMLGARELSLIRDGAILVNSARGGLIDSAALYAEFSSGRLSGALDVFPEEPLPDQSAWRELDNVIVSPHRAGYTVESHLRNGDAMVDEIGRWLRGELLQFEIPPQRVAVVA
ncbi:hydroxyacid dehydrogenase [Jiangella asiatica]|uniref:Hydroxyacid dehydrogenase n=1 Tax=Jiangella asiatica TaxID=2530372 RepID=A0A4R5CTZ9_9ACTN|nr:hydroxyacid dehydrogenase [Jiangella asiatica]TDE03107.1 hydroxyacid dehydrogenase [Jiangella asiatica]